MLLPVEMFFRCLPLKMNFRDMDWKISLLPEIWDSAGYRTVVRLCMQYLLMDRMLLLGTFWKAMVLDIFRHILRMWIVGNPGVNRKPDQLPFMVTRSLEWPLKPKT